jgi:hypothetical protein
MFRMEDLQAYMMRLFLEYARLVADEEEDMVCPFFLSMSPSRGSSGNVVDEQDFKYDPALYEFTERDECPAGEVCTVEGDAGVLSENKMPWEGDIQD